MNKLALFTSIAGLACAMTVSAATTVGTITLANGLADPSSAPSGWNGGPFNVTVQSGLTAVNSSSFVTFCLELNENLTFGPIFNATVNTVGAVYGGSGPVLNPDPLSWGTAYLYSEFRKGTLVGAYTDAGMRNLQRAIWYLEHETTYPTFTTAQGFVTAAFNASGFVGTLDEFRLVNANGAFGVAALNLTRNGSRAQDILAIVPEPSTYIAGGLALLPLLFGLRARFQRK